MSIFALHGFLGLPEDWENEWDAPNLFRPPILPFQEWAERFNVTAARKQKPRTLIGYSMGGRLALHALIHTPKLWDSAVIISAHSGLPHQEREERLRQDLIWAEKFQNQPWETLMSDWNRQPALSSSDPVIRKEKDFDRFALSQALKVWSLGQQEDLRTKISALPMKITWIVGEKDIKFRNLAESLTFKHPASRLIILPNAGHRDCLNEFKKNSNHKQIIDLHNSFCYNDSHVK